MAAAVGVVRGLSRDTVRPSSARTSRVLMQRQPPRSAAFKVKIALEAIAAQESPEQLAARHGVPVQLVFRWRDDLLRRSPRPVPLPPSQARENALAALPGAAMWAGDRGRRSAGTKGSMKLDPQQTCLPLPGCSPEHRHKVSDDIGVGALLLDTDLSRAVQRDAESNGVVMLRGSLRRANLQGARTHGALGLDVPVQRTISSNGRRSSATCLDRQSPAAGPERQRALKRVDWLQSLPFPWDDLESFLEHEPGMIRG